MFNHKYSFFADDVQVEKIKDRKFSSEVGKKYSYYLVYKSQISDYAGIWSFGVVNCT